VIALLVADTVPVVTVIVRDPAVLSVKPVPAKVCTPLSPDVKVYLLLDV
jgi:hypothetical protein